MRLLYSFALWLLLIVCTLPAAANEPVPEPVPIKEYYYRGKVIEVFEQETDDQFGLRGIDQKLKAQLTSGPYKGRVVELENFYVPGDPVFNLDIKQGTEIIVVDVGGNLEEVYVQDMARDRGVYYLAAVFLLLLVIIGRMKGVKTVISLAATGVLIFKIFIPYLLKGYNPVLLAVIVASAAVIFTLLLVGSINMKSLAAIIGTVSGVTIAGLLAMLVGNIAHLTGFNTQEAQMLYFMNQTLDVRGILFAGIIIGSMGAITDIGISIASAAAEIKEANPDIGFHRLTAGALNVGRDVIGTMSNTLLLAYVGAATPLLLLATGNEIGWLKMINLEMIATEFVRGFAGSIGLVVAVPITAFFSGLLMCRRGRRSQAAS